MDKHGEIGVYKITAGLCKKKGSVDLAHDMPTNPDHAETVDYIP